MLSVRCAVLHSVRMFCCHKKMLEAQGVSASSLPRSVFGIRYASVLRPSVMYLRLYLCVEYNESERNGKIREDFMRNLVLPIIELSFIHDSEDRFIRNVFLLFVYFIVFFKTTFENYVITSNQYF